MRIFDETKTTELDGSKIDQTMGTLVEDKLTVHHEAIPAIVEQGHWVDIPCPDGSVAQGWMVDVPPVPGVEAYDEVEDILVWKPYSETELEINSYQNEIYDQQDYLDTTDYVVSKISEAAAFGEDTDALKEKYADVIAKRKEARSRINELEELIAALK